MSKFCGKCGAPLSPDGRCQNCDPSPSEGFLGKKGNSQASFEIPQTSGNTVLAGYDEAAPDYANIPQNSPPVAYEGNVPIPNTPPVTNVPPMGQPSGSRGGSRPPRRRKKISLGVKLLCVLLVLCIITGSMTVMLYKDVFYIPTVSEGIKEYVTNKKYGEEQNYFVVTNEAVTDSKIKTAEDAYEAAKSFTKTLGYKNIKEYDYVIPDDEFEVGGYKYYRFHEKFKDVPVVGREMIIIADKDGKSCGASTNVCDLDSRFSTSIKDFDKDEVIDSLKSFEDQGIEVNVNSYTKCIYSFDRCERPMMAYEVLAVVNNMNFRIFIDPEESKIINGYSLDSYDKELAYELKGDGKDMMMNPQTIYGDKHGSLYVTSDPDRRITVYNSDKGTSTIAVEYIDKDNHSYYNRRYNPGNAEYIPNDEVCVLYDEKGDYYEYDKKKEAFVKDDTDIKLEDLKKEGYTVFNVNSNQTLLPVSSEDKTINDPLAVRLSVKTAQTYDFFKDVFDREGYDGRRGTMFAVCNDDLRNQSDKGFSAGHNDGFSMITFGYDNPMEWDDVAHEYAHSMEQSISKLFYQNESGAIMEGYADFFGELVEDYYMDTMMGEESELNNNCDWMADDRFIAMPVAKEKPTSFMDTYYTKKPKDEKWEESNLGLKNDFGGVHNNSTVISHIAYLMTNSDDEKEKLSMEEAANLWYRTLFLLPSDCSFSCFRECMELQAANMVKSKELTDKQKEYVSQCFNAANISSLRYDNEVDIVVNSDNPKKTYKVKIEGKEFKLVTLKDYSKEFKLKDGEKVSKDVFKYTESLKLNDGRYTIKVVDEDEKVNCFERDILVFSDSKADKNNDAKKQIGFRFRKIKDEDIPAPDQLKTDAPAEAPSTDMPSTDIPAGGEGMPSTDIPTGGEGMPDIEVPEEMP